MSISKKPMARQSKVLIQGGGAPGGRIEVIVPVDHTFAVEFARATYDFPGAQFMWVNSWDPEEEARNATRKAQRAASNSQMSFGEKVVGAGLLLILAMVVSVFGGDADETAPAPAEPASPYEAPAPAAPSQPAPVYVPSPSSRPVYAAEPRVTPVWEMDTDLTGNPDFTFND